MPEGDTVWHTAAILRDALAGKTLTRCDIRVPKFATVDLTGQVVDEVISRGKHLFIRVGPASIQSHLRREGGGRHPPASEEEGYREGHPRDQPEPSRSSDPDHLGGGRYSGCGHRSGSARST